MWGIIPVTQRGNMLANKKTIALSAALGLAALLFFSAEQSPAQKKKPTDKNPADEQTIRVAVEMVSLPVVVSTREGRRITDLKKEDFQIFEDGVQQTIAGFAATDEPVDVALMLDTSGSTENELVRIQNSAIDFVNQLHPDDEVSVLSFSDDVKLQGDFTIDRDKNEYAIKKTRAGGCTVEYEAVWLALDDVLKPIKERKALVLFTDGVDTCSRKASMNETLELAKETAATIYVVYYNTEGDMYTQRRGPTVGGYPMPGGGMPPMGRPYPPVYGPGGMGGTHGEYMAARNYLNKLSEYSGGLLFDGMEDLSGAYASVAKELASQYSIGYYSTNDKHDGKFRKVEVKVSKPGLAARTKKGYFAKKDKAR
jgi:VWFA-related protein